MKKVKKETAALAVGFALLLIGVSAADALPWWALAVLMLPFCVSCAASGKAQERARREAAMARAARREAA